MLEVAASCIDIGKYPICEPAMYTTYDRILCMMSLK